MLLSLWTDSINTESLIEYLAKSCTILFSNENVDIVVKFIAMNTFRDILRILEEQRMTHKKESINSEESAKIVQIIEDKLNYKELFENITPICINALNEFESPMQIWKVVNLITILIEG